MFTKLVVIVSWYMSQIIMLYTLNLHGAVCQIYLNKIGRKKGINMKQEEKVK